MDLLSNVRKSGPGHLHNLDLKISKQKVIFGELIRGFLERMSVGFVSVRLTCVIWDSILIKTVKEPNDLFVAFAIVVSQLKQDLLDAPNILHAERIVRERARNIDDYDFYTRYINFFKGMDMGHFFDDPHIDATRNNFPSL